MSSDGGSSSQEGERLPIAEPTPRTLLRGVAGTLNAPIPTPVTRASRRPPRSGTREDSARGDPERRNAAEERTRRTTDTPRTLLRNVARELGERRTPRGGTRVLPQSNLIADDTPRTLLRGLARSSRPAKEATPARLEPDAGTPARRDTPGASSVPSPAWPTPGGSVGSPASAGQPSMTPDMNETVAARQRQRDSTPILMRAPLSPGITVPSPLDLKRKRSVAARGDPARLRRRLPSGGHEIPRNITKTIFAGSARDMLVSKDAFSSVYAGQHAIGEKRRIADLAHEMLPMEYIEEIVPKTGAQPRPGE